MKRIAALLIQPTRGNTPMWRSSAAILLRSTQFRDAANELRCIRQSTEFRCRFRTDSKCRLSDSRRATLSLVSWTILDTGFFSLIYSGFVVQEFAGNLL